MEMNRRFFLKGILTSAAAGTAMVQLATPKEVEVLAVSQEVLIGQPQSLFYPAGLMSGDSIVYMRHPDSGEFEPIGYCTQIHLHTPIMENFSWEGTVQLVPGLKRATLEFKGRS